MSHTISLEINHRILSIEIGKIGKQADGTALVRYGDTVMFVSATSKREAREDKPFLPLIVDYRENTYAAGKIPGGFFKREGRPSEREILVARLIDRPVRSLFPDGYFFETQIVGLLLSADLENEPDILGLIGASAALYFSDIPFTTPIGAVKVGLIDGQYVINPPAKELEASPLNLLVVGTEDGVTMIEAAAKEVDEEKILEAIAAAMAPIRQIIEIQKEHYQKLNIKKREFAPKLPDPAKLADLETKIGPALFEAIQTSGKKASEEAVTKILKSLLEPIPEENAKEKLETKELFYKVQEKLARRLILDHGRRADGRGFEDIRPIQIEVGLLPRTHGSALFTRGETQCLATVTLGTPEDVQRLDSLGEETKKRFMLHYNFPPFSVGEVGFLRGPGRREIGHGALAEKSFEAVLPLPTGWRWQYGEEMGLSIVFVTHELALVGELCPDVCVMYAGRLVETGRTADLLARPLHPYTIGLLASAVDLDTEVSAPVPIPGSLPDPLNRPSGCAFHPRCFMARPTCETADVPLVPAGDGRASACLYVDELMRRGLEERVP